MSNVRLGESSDMYDFTTGRWLGVLDQRGNEVYIPSAVTDPLTGRATGLSTGGEFVAEVGFDVCVVGATPAGIAAAVAAARQNRRVLLVSENERIGGMLGWGITYQDLELTAPPATVVGFAKELFKNIASKETTGYRNWWRYYRASFPGNPNWFIRAMNEVVAKEGNISIMRNATCISATKSGTKVTAASFSNGVSVKASAWVDASYTGDLSAAAGCTVSIGRESTALYSETLAGIRTPDTFLGGVTPDAYVTAGVPASGLLPYVSPTLGTVGAGDGRVMAFNYRLAITNDAARRTAFPAPNMATYNPQNYELLARAMAIAPTSYNAFNKVFALYANVIDTALFDMNTVKGISTNYPNADECLEYVTATPERRAVIRENAKQYLLGLLYWIRYSGDGRIPAALVTDIANYGLLNTDLQAYGGFSPEFYVREGRRVVGDFVLKYGDMLLATSYTDTIAFGYYQFDRHQARIVLDAGVAKPEGNINQIMTTSQIGCPIPYRVLLPKATEVTNLLCPGSPSVSCVAWAALRLEPMLLAIGQAAGVAAAYVAENNVNAADVPFVRIRRVCDIQGVLDGIVLSTDGTYVEGTVTQTPGASWSASSTAFGFVGASSLNDGNTGKGKTLRFAPNIQEAGAYRVYFKYPPAATNRANNVPVTISHASGTTTMTVNQIWGAGGGNGIGGDWEDLGVYNFRIGTPSADYVEIGTTATSSFVVASAVKFVPVAGQN